jgi:hypothetical protein
MFKTKTLFTLLFLTAGIAAFPVSGVAQGCKILRQKAKPVRCVNLGGTCKGACLLNDANSPGEETCTCDALEPPSKLAPPQCGTIKQREVECKVNGHPGFRRDVCANEHWTLGVCRLSAAPNCVEGDDRDVRCTINGRSGYHHDICRKGRWVSGRCRAGVIP